MAQRKQHPDKALSPAEVRNKKIPGRYADGNGLYLVVDPSGAKRWLLRTVIRRKRRDMGLGGLKLVSLAEARESARHYRKIARDGGDPIAERKRDTAVIPTFQEAAKEVHANRAKEWQNEKHSRQWLSALERHVYPVFGDTRIDLIDSSDVLKALSPIWSSHHETAKRVCRRISDVLDWAKASKYRLDDNPVPDAVIGLSKPKRSDNHHEAMPFRDVPQFIKLLHASDALKTVKLAFEFLILTAARTNEVLGAKWDEITIDDDEGGASWTIPASRMKAKREFRVPLSPRCVEILEEAKKTASGEYIFPGRGLSRPLAGGTFLVALRRLGETATAHGFRSSFRDWASETTNFPNRVCEMALAHSVKNKAEGAYRRADLFQKRRDLMDTWAAFVAAESADVIPLNAGSGNV